jgi:hypothetical protein
MKVVLTLLTLAMVAMSTQAKKWNQNSFFPQFVRANNGTRPNATANATEIAEEVRYTSALLRGFIQGYRRGMYKENSYKVAPECFD